MRRDFQEEKIFMNTKVKITVLSDLSTLEVYDLLDGAFDKFNYVMKKFSRFDPASELSILNSRRSYNASQELFDLIEKSLEISKISEFKYDPTIQDILDKYGFGNKKDFEKLLDEKKVIRRVQEAMQKRKKPGDIILEKENNKIILAEDQTIDLGSIAKGYAIDLAKSYLRHRVDHFSINAGGDIYVSGLNPQGHKWKIGLPIPNKEDAFFGYLELSDISLACSGIWMNRLRYFNHLIDPFSGQPVEDTLSAFVLHKKAHMSDAYATMLSLMSRDGLKVLEEQKIGGLIVTGDSYIKNSYFPEII